MRVISQNGDIDVSYENGSLVMSCGKYKDVEYVRITYYNTSCPRGTLLAEYKSKDKALRALELLRGVYIGYIVEKTYHEGTCDCMPIFQFPKDEEVEE